MHTFWLIAPGSVFVASLWYALAPRYHESRAERSLQRGRDRQATLHLEAARKSWVKRKGENSIEAASALAGLARIRFLQGATESGAGLLDRAARSVYAYQGRPTRRLVIALIRLGQAANVAVRYNEAVAIGEKALALAGRVLYGADPSLGAIEAMLGDGYAGLALFEQAHARYGRALEIYRLNAGEDSPDAAVVLATMAAAMVREERWKEARETGLEAVEILDHQDSVRLPEALGALAELHARRGRFAEAEGLRLSICHLWEKVGGPDSALLAREYERRAELLRSMERKTEAGYLQGKADKIRSAVAAA